MTNLYIPSEKQKYSELHVSRRQRIQCHLHVKYCINERCSICIFRSTNTRTVQQFERWEIEKGFIKPKETENELLKKRCDDLEQQNFVLKQSVSELREMLSEI